MEIKLEKVYKYLKKEILEDTVEEYLFRFNVDFFHLLSLVWSKSSAKKVTPNYCAFLLSNCLHYIINAAKLSDIGIDDMEKDITASYSLFKKMLYNGKNADMLITAFNGETILPKEYDSIAKFALLLLFFEDKMNIGWSDIIEALETIKIC